MQEDIADIRHLYRMQLNGLLEEKAATIMESKQQQHQQQSGLSTATDEEGGDNDDHERTNGTGTVISLKYSSRRLKVGYVIVYI